MTISGSTTAGRRGAGLLALVSIGILVATLMLGLRVAPAFAVSRGPECLQPLDVVFIIDRSGSMGDDSTGNSRLFEAQTAAKSFVATLDAAGGVGGSGLHQVGLVSFSDGAAVNLPLGGSSASDFNNAINPLNPNGFTNTKAAIAAGLGELTGSARRSEVNGVAVTHAYVLLSDGRPWSSSNPGSDPNRPSAGDISAYLAGADQAFSIMLGQSDGHVPPTSNTLDPDLMNALAAPAGSPSDNFFAVTDASKLGNIFDKIVHGLLCGDIQITKDADPTQLPVGGGDVTYTYHVSHIAQGGTPFSDVSVSDDKCSPVAYVSGDDGDKLLEFGETWVFSCTTKVAVDTLNTACVAGTYVDSGGATIPEDLYCAQANVTVKQSVAESVPPASAAQSVEAGTGTPAASQPNTSLTAPGGGMLPTILFSFLLIASLGTLAYTNVRAMRRRS